MKKYNQKHDFVTLGMLAEVNPGTRVSLHSDDEVAFLAMADVEVNGRILRYQQKKYREVKSGYTTFVENDVLVAKITPCFENGKGTLVTNMPSSIGFGSTEFHVLRSNQKTCPQYLAYITLSPKFRRLGSSEMVGSAGQKRIQPQFIQTYHVPDLNHDEQRRIVTILSTWDRAIELSERLLVLREKRKRALMQQLLTGKMRFPGFVTKKDLYATRFGLRPKDWRNLEFGDIAVEVNERAGESCDYAVLSCTKYDGLVPSLEYFGRRIFSEDISPYKVVRRNQFAYATNHIEEGSIGVLDTLEAGLVSPMYTVFKTKKGVSVRFLIFLFKTELYRHIFEVTTSASINRRGSLRWKEFQRIHVALPPFEEQDKIATLLNTCDVELDQNKAKITSLKNQKKGLMQQLLTGKVRVPVDNKGE